MKVNPSEVIVLRLGHRLLRDKRTTSHIFLAARALGADKVVYTGKRDVRIEDDLKEVVRKWGGTFEVEHTPNWTRYVRSWREKGGEIVHLTMYGLPLLSVISKIQCSMKKKLVVVGGAKVSGKLYSLADWNVAVTSQPHSEVSALCVFLHELFEGNELMRTYLDAEIVIIPQVKGKKIIKKKEIG